MEKKPNEVVLVKIPLKELIDTLVMIYRDGADYIDIIGVPDEIQDSIGIMVKNEYFADYEHNEQSANEMGKGDISETDLNDLI
jgi:hypothetical protein